jgi:hypothetical protein
MKNKKITVAAAALLLIGGISIVSCKKHDTAVQPAKTTTTTTAPTDETQATNDHMVAENTSGDIDNMLVEGMESGSISTYRLNNGQQSIFGGSPCISSFVNDTTNKLITVTFNGQTCLDGHKRSGSISFNYASATPGAKHYRNPGFKCVVSSQNYKVDSNAVTIFKSVINTTASGFNPATTDLTWTDSTNLSIVKPNGTTVSFHSTRNTTLLNTGSAYVLNGNTEPAAYVDQSTPILWNKAVIGTTGDATGTIANGTTYNYNITSQLIRDMNCFPVGILNIFYHPFIEGKVTYTLGTLPVCYIDFGAGICDIVYTLTINGVAHTMYFPV